jgi:hypothetical protein
LIDRLFFCFWFWFLISISQSCFLSRSQLLDDSFFRFFRFLSVILDSTFPRSQLLGDSFHHLILRFYCYSCSCFLSLWNAWLLPSITFDLDCCSYLHLVPAFSRSELPDYLCFQFRSWSLILSLSLSSFRSFWVNWLVILSFWFRSLILSRSLPSLLSLSISWLIILLFWVWLLVRKIDN